MSGKIYHAYAVFFDEMFLIGVPKSSQLRKEDQSTVINPINSRHSINIKLLAIVLVVVVVLAALLNIMSINLIRSSFFKLYVEKLYVPGRILLSQYAHYEFSHFIEVLESKEGFAEQARRFLDDQMYVENIDQMNEQNQTKDYPPEYALAMNRLNAYAEEFSALKDSGYRALNRSMLQIQVSTGFKKMYVVTDLGFDGGYVCVINAVYSADAGMERHDDFGTMIPKSLHPEIKTVYETAEPVYVIGGKNDQDDMCHSYLPITNGFREVVAVICVDINLESVDEQVEQFIRNSVIMTVVITTVLIFLLYFILQGLIVRPIRNLTVISKQISQGNVFVEISPEVINRKDEMGTLGESFEGMRKTLERLISSNKELFDSIITGNMNARGDSSGLEGLYARLIENTNDTIDVIQYYFDNIPASFAILDSAYDIVFSNDTFHRTFDRVSSKDLYKAILDDSDINGSYKSVKERFSLMLQEGELNCLRWIRFTGGEERCYTFTCKPVGQGAEKNGAIIIILDSTELVLAKDKALSANRAKSEFLSRISHELRTPMNAVLGMAKLALNDDRLDKCQNRLAQIISSSEHLAAIINDVLEMSRMESGKTDIRKASMDVSVLVEDCAAMILPRTMENNNKLLTQVDPGIPKHLIGDEFRIKQVLLNLLSNAAKFTENGSISIEVSFANQTNEQCLLNFVVADTGIGMSQSFLGKIFVPFEQEESFLSRRYEGSGLGLTISNNLIMLMGGSLRVKSALGEGSSFSFLLPFELAPEDSTPKLETEKENKVISLVGKRLLIVDDIDINRMIVCEILADTGVEIQEATDGLEAFEVFTSSPMGYFDCILMDIQMPRMDGYKTTEAIRQSGREDCSVPIVAMTANALREDIDQALAVGMNDHLAKPIDFDLCVRTIGKYCTERS